MAFAACGRQGVRSSSLATCNTNISTAWQGISLSIYDSSSVRYIFVSDLTSHSRRHRAGNTLRIIGRRSTNSCCPTRADCYLPPTFVGVWGPGETWCSERVGTAHRHPRGSPPLSAGCPPPQVPVHGMSGHSSARIGRTGATSQAAPALPAACHPPSAVDSPTPSGSSDHCFSRLSDRRSTVGSPRPAGSEGV